MLGLVLVAVGLLVASGLAAALLARVERLAVILGTAGCVLACLVGLGAACRALLVGETGVFRGSWSVPVGELHVGLDALSAFFLVCVFVVSALAALYGRGYLAAYAGRRALAPAVALFNLLVASMAVVVIARDGVLFLVAWEVMSLSALFLVTFESEREEVRRAGMTYLIASHIGVAFLFLLFTKLSAQSGSYDFDTIALAGAPAEAGVCFLVALVGFGTKAGFWPLHVWLPDAHPAAPSHVSAVMSGVMIKMGIYGLLRVLTLLGPPPASWGAVLISIGITSGVAGLLLALAQRDLKRMLAYSSVENVGIIALGLGVGLLGQSHGRPVVAFLGFAGALAHVLSHGLMKGLLFQAAGSVAHGTGTRRLDALGALLRRMPTTGVAFLVGSVAICGLPPLNGFVGEWLIYVGAFRGATSAPTGWAALSLVVVPTLALIGGLAAACYVRAFGVVFLGEPRTEAAHEAHESTGTMRAAMLIDGALCLGFGLWPAGLLRLVAPAAASLARFGGASTLSLGPLTTIAWVALLFVVLVAVLARLRAALLARRTVGSACTWGCGYAAPTPRMQYTAVSFAGPMLAPFQTVLDIRVNKDGPMGVFPSEARYDEQVSDMAGERLLVPAARRFLSALARLRVIQQGRVQLYLLYVLITLVVLFFWQLGGAT